MVFMYTRSITILLGVIIKLRNLIDLVKKVYLLALQKRSYYIRRSSTSLI
jgi:hypothetical protein